VKPIVALDIDGTLGDYHGHFTRFAEQWLGRDLPAPSTINPGLPLYRHLGMSKATYRQCKLAYRQGGMKRSMPMTTGADLMCRAFRKAGAEVWICTTRPYLRLDNIDPDTRHWLRRNKIQYDAVLWGEHKYRDLVKNCGDKARILGVLEDLPELLQQATDLGLEAWRCARPYNAHVAGLYPTAWPGWLGPPLGPLQCAFTNEMLEAIATYRKENR
jgi:hypothetical protein